MDLPEGEANPNDWGANLLCDEIFLELLATSVLDFKARTDSLTGATPADLLVAAWRLDLSNSRT